jgi:hypothetical protein
MNTFCPFSQGNNVSVLDFFFPVFHKFSFQAGSSPHEFSLLQVSSILALAVFKEPSLLPQKSIGHEALRPKSTACLSIRRLLNMQNQIADAKNRLRE